MQPLSQRTPLLLMVASAVVAVAAPARAVTWTTVFSDNFNSGPSSRWGNQLGNWTTNVGGAYYAQSPSNSPPSASLLSNPALTLTDFAVDVDVNGAVDGGIWLRSDATRSNAVLLVIGGDNHSFTGFYFHEITGGVFSLEEGKTAPNLFSQGANIHVRAEVLGNSYKVYLNGGVSPAASLTTSAYSSGLTGLYDFTGTTFGNQSFDNFVVQVPVPEPSALLLLAPALLTLSSRRLGRRIPRPNA